MSFCERLKKRREELKLSRKEVAALIGATPSAVANYENGISHPKIDVLYKIFSALQIDPNYLYQDEFTSESLVSANIEAEYTDHEKAVIGAYRAKPQMQEAVDTLLGVPKEE